MFGDLVVAACLVASMLGTAQAQAPGLGASVELVDPKVFRVCADPRNLPFSDQAGEGFENKLAQLFAAKLGKSVSYTYFPQIVGFYRNTLNAFRCDVVMGVPSGSDLVQTTIPYYHTIYELVVRPNTGLDEVETLADPRLREKRIGIVAGTPPATIMAEAGLMAKAKPYPLMIDTRHDSSTKEMIDDLLAGRIDAAILWGPIAGYYIEHAGTPLKAIPLAKDQGEVPMDFRIAMGVRRSDQEWRRTLNRLIKENQEAINTILLSYSVPLLDDEGKLIKP
ncbi:MAG: substrate-binding domain-containing protein [Acetobacteraceae bacterium]|nr:substrate-binding domain-containing protein [Acetobacteraceae bacterium]